MTKRPLLKWSFCDKSTRDLLEEFLQQQYKNVSLDEAHETFSAKRNPAARCEVFSFV